jgi:hypothetical protein
MSFVDSLQTALLIQLEDSRGLGSCFDPVHGENFPLSLKNLLYQTVLESLLIYEMGLLGKVPVRYPDSRLAPSPSRLEPCPEVLEYSSKGELA